jgi:hypothetical protein
MPFYSSFPPSLVALETDEELIVSLGTPVSYCASQSVTVCRHTAVDLTGLVMLIAYPDFPHASAEFGILCQEAENPKHQQTTWF